MSVIRKTRVLLLSVLAAFAMSLLPATALAAGTEGNYQYAVLEDSGVLTFFRANEPCQLAATQYEMDKPATTVTDVDGNTYTGYVFETWMQTPVHPLSWQWKRDAITEVKVTDGEIVTPFSRDYNSESLGGWFEGCSNLKTVSLNGACSGFNQAEWAYSEQVDLRKMFKDCKSLQSVDFTGSDFASDNGLVQTFMGCESLVEVKGLSTEYVHVFGSMSIEQIFDGCSSLQSFGRDGYLSMHSGSAKYAFRGCSSLKYLDYNFSDMSNYEGIFDGCESLVEIDSCPYNLYYYGTGASLFPVPSDKGYSGKWVSKKSSEAFTPEEIKSNWSQSGWLNTHGENWKAQEKLATDDQRALLASRLEKAKTLLVPMSTDGSDIGQDAMWTTLDDLNSLLAALESANSSLSNESLTYNSADAAIEDMENAILDYEAARRYGTRPNPPTPAPVETVRTYRLYNPYSGEHFYTMSENESAELVIVGWRLEGLGWISPAESDTPVYRLYNPYAGDHHYTTSSAERDMLTNVGWIYEGIGWYSADSSGVPIYRQYNPNAVSGAHNYTMSAQERDMLVSVGWRDEQIGWYGL